MLVSSKTGNTQVFVSVFISKLILFSVVLFFVAIAFATDTFPHGEKTVLILLLVILPFSSALNSTWYLHAKGQFIPVAYIAILGTLSSLAIGFNMVTDESNLSFISAAISYALVGIITGAGTFLISCHLTSSFQYVRWIDIAGSLKCGKSLFISQLLSIGYTGSGTIIIGALAGLQEAGIYGVMERIMGAALGGALLLHTAAYPKLVLLYSKNRNSYFSLLRAVVIAYIAVVSALSIFAWYLNEQIFVFMYGITGPRPYVLFALALVWITIGIGGTALTGYFAVSHRPNEVLMLTLKILVFSLMLGVPGAYYYGGTGWLAALLAAQILVLSSALKFRKIENTKYGYKSIQ